MSKRGQTQADLWYLYREIQNKCDNQKAQLRVYETKYRTYKEENQQLRKENRKLKETIAMLEQQIEELTFEDAVLDGDEIADGQDYTEILLEESLDQDLVEVCKDLFEPTLEEIEYYSHRYGVDSFNYEDDYYYV